MWPTVACSPPSCLGVKATGPSSEDRANLVLDSLGGCRYHLRPLLSPKVAPAHNTSLVCTAPQLPWLQLSKAGTVSGDRTPSRCCLSTELRARQAPCPLSVDRAVRSHRGSTAQRRRAAPMHLQQVSDSHRVHRTPGLGSSQLQTTAFATINTTLCPQAREPPLPCAREASGFHVNYLPHPQVPKTAALKVWSTSWGPRPFKASTWSKPSL